MLQMYSIYDKKALFFERPFFVKHVAEALRMVQMALREGKSQQALYPADYALYLVGTFHPEGGTVISPALGEPQFTMELAALLTPEPPAPVPQPVNEGASR